MKKLFLLFIIGLINFSIYSQTKIRQSLDVWNSPGAETLKNVSFTYSIIPSLNNTWGYDIYLGKQLLFHQPSIPGLPGNNGFKTKAKAEKAAQHVIRNMKKDQVIPGFTINSSAQAPNTWNQKANFGGTARYYAVGFSIGLKGYIGTGNDSTSALDLKKDFWEYDPATNTWTQKADFGGVARWYAVGFSIGSKGYIGTGQNMNFNYLNDFWEYDPSANTWTQKANFGGAPITAAVGFNIGSKGYIGTGFNSSWNSTKDFWEYDPSNNTWTQKANFGGAARHSAVGFSIGNKGYIGTGIVNTPIYFNDLWEYDPFTDTWTQKANYSGGPRYQAVGFGIGNKGYIGTGEDDISTGHNDFWEYNPAVNNWTQKANFGGGPARVTAVGFSIGSRGFIGTGLSGLYLDIREKDFWEYTSSCILPPNPSNTTPVENQTICSGNSTILSASGTGTLGWYNAATGGTWLGGGSTFITPVLLTNTTYYVQDSTCDASATRTIIAVTVNTPPVPTIMGQTSMCVNSGYYNYITEAGMFNYSWAVSPGGLIIYGSGTNDILVSWITAGQQTVSVTYSDLGCNAVSPTVFNVTVNPLPAQADSITGEAAVCIGDNGISYFIAPVLNAVTYVWSLPAGSTIASGFGTNAITVNFADYASSGDISVYGNNLCGNGIPSPNLYVTINPRPITPIITENGDTLLSSAPYGNQWFYNGILLVNDTNQSYIVSPYLPGYYWTQVTIGGCVSDTSNHIYCNLVGVNEQHGSRLSLYPNPVTVVLSIEVKTEDDNIKYIEIYESNGIKIFESQTRERKIDINTNNYPAGIYFVKLKTGNSIFTEKFCKN
jgi:N-acetylneuraminic acid mutarotase